MISFVDLKTRTTVPESSLEGGKTVNVLVELPSVPFGEDLIASGCFDDTVRVWKKSEREQIAYFGHDDFVFGLDVVPFRKWIVSGSADTTVRIWDLETEKGVPDGIMRHHIDFVNEILFHEEQNCIVSGSDDKTIRMFSLSGFDCCKEFDGTSMCRSLVVHPTNTNLFLSGHSEGEIELWDIRKEDSIGDRKLHGKWVERIISVGEDRFASCSRDGTLEAVKIWTDTLFQAGRLIPQRKILALKTGRYNQGLCCVGQRESDVCAASQQLKEEIERISFLTPFLRAVVRFRSGVVTSPTSLLTS